VSDAEDLDALAERVNAQSDHLRAKTSQRRLAREWAEKEVAAVRGTAASGDGLVRATVDNAGVLLELELSPLARRAGAVDLGLVITSVVQQAAARARNQVREVYSTLQNEGVIKALPPHLLSAPSVEQVGSAVPIEPGEPRSPGSETEATSPAVEYGYLGREEDGGTGSGEDSSGEDGDPEGPPATWLDVRETW
jgi:hypothetical protein